MSKASCPLCNAELELPDGLPRHIVRCPGCNEQFGSDEAVAPPATEAPAPGAAGAYRMDTRAITQAIPPPPSDAAHPPTSPSPDPLGAYRGDTLAMTRPPPTPPPPPPPADEGGERFGAFDLLDKLGASDVAVTYRARWRAQGDMVALKVFAPGETATSEEIAVLVERARAASRLMHDGIARIIEVRRRDDMDYVASEFIPGRSLADILDVGEPRGGDAVEMAREIAWILDRAHRAGVVHGNLKPSNVIVDEKGEPHVTDFGLARELWRLSPEHLRSTTGTGPALPLYVAPEQLRGEAPTATSDVYSLGALLYHMIARRPPFEGRDILEVVLAIDRGRPVPPASVNSGCPPAVNAIVLKCLEREPRHRYATAEELASEIERFRHGKKTRTRAPGAGTRLLRALAPRWKASAAIIALASAAAGGAWFAARSSAMPEWLAAIGGAECRAKATFRAADNLALQKRWDEAERKLAPLESREGLPAWVRSGVAARFGVIKFHRGMYEEAADQFSRAIGIRPGGDADNHYYYGAALWHAGGDPKRIAAELREALRLGSARAASANGQYQYARACELAGERAEARRAFERVIDIDPAFKADLISVHLAKLKP